jgi:hypothetical protein
MVQRCKGSPYSIYGLLVFSDFFREWVVGLRMHMHVHMHMLSPTLSNPKRGEPPPTRRWWRRPACSYAQLRTLIIRVLIITNA